MASSDRFLSYKEWIIKNPSISFDKRLQKYDDYLQTVLVDEVAIVVGETKNELRDTYISFLKRISVFYEDDEEIIDLRNINFEDDAELAAAIPILASKVRDIAFFYMQKRKDLGNEKTALSRKGSFEGFEDLIHRLFIRKYSKGDGYLDPTVTDEDVLGSVPDQKELVDMLDVSIDELINTTSQTPLGN